MSFVLDLQAMAGPSSDQENGGLSSASAFNCSNGGSHQSGLSLFNCC